ncbi:MAG: hypothetical protein QGG39_10150 [Candidatus Poribacteria bacterium]|nr:hypothetical protein [Candidatus Poribacteria bacterium]
MDANSFPLATVTKTASGSIVTPFPVDPELTGSPPSLLEGKRAI